MVVECIISFYFWSLSFCSGCVSRGAQSHRLSLERALPFVYTFNYINVTLFPFWGLFVSPFQSSLSVVLKDSSTTNGPQKGTGAFKQINQRAIWRIKQPLPYTQPSSCIPSPRIARGLAQWRLDAQYCHDPNGLHVAAGVTSPHQPCSRSASMFAHKRCGWAPPHPRLRPSRWLPVEVTSV